MAFNKVILMGRLTAAPEMKQTQNGKSIVTPGVAINEGKDNTTFVDFYAFDKTADFIARYFHKGDPIIIEGRVTSHKVERDGKTRTELGIVCDRACFAEIARNEQGGIISPPENPNATQGKISPSAPYAPSSYIPDQYKSQPQFEEISTDADLPF